MINSKKNQKELKDVIELYTGQIVKKIDLYPDPINSMYTAVRVQFEDNNVASYVYYLFQSFDGKYDYDSLEEVEFETWPPKSDKKNMGKLENMNVTTISC